MVDSSVFAEHFTRNQLAKTYDFTGMRVDSDVGFPCGHEKHLVGGIEIVDNRISAFVSPPGTSPLNARQSVR
jgi:hypothetical protein